MQFQALLPVDLEHHLYSGSTLYDLEKHEFRKISTVVKTSRKSGYSTTITFVGGAKRTLTDTESLMEFARSHQWVSLREMNEGTHFQGVPTGITQFGRIMVEQMIKEQLNVRFAKHVAARHQPKKRWFR